MTQDPALAVPIPNHPRADFIGRISSEANDTTTMADLPQGSVMQASLPAQVSEAGPADTRASRVSAQLKKLTEANGKYKNLLILAKERIQKQDEELERVRTDKEELERQLVADEKEASKQISLDEGVGEPTEESSIVNVCQRVKVPRDDDSEEYWALLEMEVISHQDMFDAPARRYKEWKRFDTESELQDFIRRDTGEPLVPPPYSISPEQSARIQEEASKRVSQVTEEFRRFRVRSELARKQADAQIRDLQSTHVQSAAKRIEGQQDRRDSDQVRGGQAERLKAELVAQEAQWKEAYDVLLQENTALKSSGSEALLAAQWRQRYEACLKEKEALQASVKLQLEKSDKAEGDKYELKYRDLKESFRLYRKKAKEIFESQHHGNEGPAVPHDVFSISDTSADAKLAYLRNLMVNYLSAETAVKEHMEGAIRTILQFTPEEMEQIEKKKLDQEAWF
jgi:hypothetical protein